MTKSATIGMRVIDISSLSSFLFASHTSIFTEAEEQHMGQEVRKASMPGDSDGTPGTGTYG
jgi:hypothetical protein